MKLLLGATIALLLAALVMSWNQTRHRVENTPPDVLAKLSREIEELRLEGERLELERQVRQLRESPRMPATPVAPAQNPEIEAMKAELAAKEAALRAIEEEKARAERDAEVFREEAGLAGQREIENSDQEMRRARLIRDALLVARISEYAADEFGAFCTIELLMPENIQSGMTLAIRRQSGILGHIRVSSIEGMEAIASPLPGFGEIEPRPGDELIIPPPFD